MGYCYSNGGALACDVCGVSGGVRKVKCPFGWCQPAALCAGCKKKHPQTMDKHREDGCERQSNAMKERDEKEKSVLDSGGFVRKSALAYANDMVQVLFWNKDGKYIGKAMPRATYHAIPLRDIATPEDYAKVSPIYDAPNDFHKPGGAGLNGPFEAVLANGSSIVIGGAR